MKQTNRRLQPRRLRLSAFMLAVACLGSTGCDAPPLWLDDEPNDSTTVDDLEDGGQLGAACSHFEGSEPQFATVTAPAEACASRVCVFAETFEPRSERCRTNADCNVFGNVERFHCVATADDAVDGLCRMRPEYVAERSMCSAACEDDLDCGEAVSDTNCKSGFSCRVMTSLGALCCKKMCVCNDLISEANSEAHMCELQGNQCLNTMDKFRAAPVLR